MDKEVSFEIRRKTFHLTALIFPIIYLHTSKLSMVLVLLLLSTITTCIDNSRVLNSKIQDVVNIFFSTLMRDYEKHSVSGVSYMFYGLFASCVLFDKPITICSWYILVVSDSIAALVGVTLGKHKCHGKSVEGGVAFFASAFIIGYYALSISVISLMFACLATTVVELFSNKVVNDNLAIPTTFGLCIYVF